MECVGDTYNVVYAEWFDWYTEPKDVEEWLECTRCGHKPRVWEFDNGRYAECACASKYSKYDKLKISAESIMSVVNRTGGVAEYDREELKNNWNEHVKGQ